MSDSEFLSLMCPSFHANQWKNKQDQLLKYDITHKYLPIDQTHKW